MPRSEEKNEFTIEEEKTLLHTRIGDVLSARVTSHRKGRDAQFYRFAFSDWVNIIALTPDLQVVLVNQYRFGSGRYELEIPGGAIENGESPLGAGLRELLEETGFAGRDGRIIGKVCPNPALQSNFCYTVLVENVERVADQQMDDMEDIEVLTIPLTEIDHLIRSEKITHGLVLNAFMLYERRRNP
ncbi:MAG: NUDIX hydrolase [Desulfocapsaceae bacterium]|nr:NUDIX hydrolase [Desulfocapsaceae bacterium]